MLFCAATGVVSLIVLFFGIRFLLARRVDAAQLAAIQSRNLAHSIEQNLSGSFQRIDLVLNAMAGELEAGTVPGRIDQPRMASLLHKYEQALPEAVAIRVSDARGRVILGNATGDPAALYAGLDFFTRLQADGAAGMFTGRPRIGVFTHRWVIPCARRYQSPAGAFAGVVVVTVSFDHFRNLLAGYEVGPGGTLSLRDGDGGFVVRQPEPASGQFLAVGERASSAELMAFVRSGLHEETHFAKGTFDHVPRTYTTTRIPGIPLMIGVGLAEADYLAPWRRDRARTGAMLGATLLCVWILAAMLWRSWAGHLRDAEALRSSQARLLHAERVAGFGNWELDLDGHRLRASQGATLIYGLPGEAWALADVRGLVLPEFLGLLDTAMTDLVVAGRPYDIQFTIRRGGDGELRTIHSMAEHDPGRGLDFGVIQDITDMKLEEVEKRRLQSQLHQAQKMESLGSLAGGIAHDMNNVLAAVLALSTAHQELLPADSPLHQAFGTITEAATRGGNMVRSLLAFARQRPAEEARLDLNQLIQRNLSLLQRTTFLKVRFQPELAPDLAPILGDESALANVLMNLCVNAVDAMADNGLLTLRTRNDGRGWVEVEVADTGHGMAPEVLAKAMEPFYTTKEQVKGTGLGLAMVYSTVKAHRGTVDIQSEAGRGTRVLLRFPACT